MPRQFIEAVVGDVTDEAAVRRVVSEADRPDAPLEVAVFNAGGNWPRPFRDMDGNGVMEFTVQFFLT